MFQREWKELTLKYLDDCVKAEDFVSKSNIVLKLFEMLDEYWDEIIYYPVFVKVVREKIEQFLNGGEEITLVLEKKMKEYKNKWFSIELVCKGVCKNGNRCKLKIKNGYCKIHLHQEEDNICSICCESTNFKFVDTLGCNHIFHHNCIREWFKIKSTCPLCRQ